MDEQNALRDMGEWMAEDSAGFIQGFRADGGRRDVVGMRNNVRLVLFLPSIRRLTHLL